VRTIVVDGLLLASVLAELVCVLGLVWSTTVFDRLHYAGATTAVAPFLILAAVALRQPTPTTAPVWNALFVAVVLFALNNVLSHAIARVARQREAGELEL
jgi:monovalent cation/proton antiporter MnhG/PhaG subunit